MSKLLKKTKLVILGIFIGGAVGGASVAFSDEKKPDTAQLLKDASLAQGFSADGLSWVLELDSVDHGKSTKAQYAVQTKGENTIASTLEPAAKKGQVYLRSKDNLWFYKPGLKKPMAVSANQKLDGQSSNAELASINYEKDYDGTIIGEESIDGADTWVIKLKAKGDAGAYDTIKSWISKDKHLNMKMEYYAVSGDLMKRSTMEYKNSCTNGKSKVPLLSAMKIVSATNPADVTVITYSDVKEKNLPDSLFHRDSLVK